MKYLILIPSKSVYWYPGRMLNSKAPYDTVSEALAAAEKLNESRDARGLTDKFVVARATITDNNDFFHSFV